MHAALRCIFAVSTVLQLASPTLAYYPPFAPATVRTATTACNPACTDLSAIQPWAAEAGYLVGNYTLYNADGLPYESGTWPYPFASYRGFELVVADGPCLTTRTLFVYQPLSPGACAARRAAGLLEAVGNGVCGVHGNERAFAAAATASDCQGGVAGTLGPFATEERPLDAARAEYALRTSDGSLRQTEQRVVSTEFRARSKLSVDEDGAAKALYFKRERHVDRAEFLHEIAAARAAANVRAEDFCMWKPGNRPSGYTCEELFQVPECPARAQSGACNAQRMSFGSWLDRAVQCGLYA